MHGLLCKRSKFSPEGKRKLQEYFAWKAVHSSFISVFVTLKTLDVQLQACDYEKEINANIIYIIYCFIIGDEIYMDKYG